MFPGGLDDYDTPSQSLPPSLSLTPSTTPSTSTRPSLFSRFLGNGSSLTVSSRTPSPPPRPDGPPEEVVISGTAFGRAYFALTSKVYWANYRPGYGLFNLVLSMLPGKAKYVTFGPLTGAPFMRRPRYRTVVGFFGYDYSRRIALQALAVSAAKSDVHSIFAGYVT